MIENTKFAILLGGALTVNARLEALIAGARAIAADGGIRHAGVLGLAPELWVGDFDSASLAEQSAWAHIPRQVYPAAKDLTDGEIAIQAAIERGADRIVMVGAMAGERSDHALLHMLQAITLAQQGIDVVLSSGEEEAVPLLEGQRKIELRPGATFSILALSDLGGLTIEGARYPLARAHVPFAASRTLSNVAAGPVRISLDSGRGLVIARPDDLSGV